VPSLGLSVWISCTRASLVTQVRVVNLSKMVKPDIVSEATTGSTIRTLRGKGVLRVQRRWRMNVGDPNPATDELWEWESDMPVVVKRDGKVKPSGAKGHYCNTASDGEGHRRN
jgi:hypothetical protein